MNSHSKNLIAGWYKSHPAIFFVVAFALQMIVFYLLYYNQVVEDNFILPVASGYAKIASHLINIFGYNTTAAGDIISSEQFSVLIKKGCDALEPMALFVSGLIAFPSSLKKKIYGLLPGLLILFLLNIIRIASLFITGVKSPELFEVMHMKLWQVVFIIIAISLWYIWLRWSIPKKPVA